MTPGLLGELSMCARWHQREGRTPQRGLVLRRGKMSSSVLFTPAGAEVQGRPPKESHGEIKQSRVDGRRPNDCGKDGPSSGRGS